MVAPRFTKIFSISVLVAFLISSAESANKIQCPPEAASVAYEGEKTESFIIVLEEKSAAEKHLDFLKECTKKTIETFSTANASAKKDQNVVEDLSFDGFSGYTGKFGKKFLAEQIEKLGGVKIIEKDSGAKISYALPERRAVDNKPQQNLDRIDQAKFPLDNKFIFPDSAGKGVDIYIIDTGISIKHKEFENRARNGGAFCAGCNENDEHGHGTHVASIAAGKTLGVARKANLIAIRVLNKNGFGLFSEIIKGMMAVIDQHKKSKNKKSVANMSLGGGVSQAVTAAVKAMTDAGIHVAVAAGNDFHSDSCTKSPASAPTAITVGATEKTSDKLAIFSNVGKCVDIFAPGVNIVGADAFNLNGQKIFSGTSQATPHVAGTVALIISKGGNKKPADMAKTLINLSTKNVVQGLPNGVQNRFLRVPKP